MEGAIRVRRVSIAGMIVGVLAVVWLLGATAANQWNSKRTRELAVAALISELTSIEAQLRTALDSTSRQIEQTQRFIGWLEQTEDASSAALVRSMAELRQPHRAPVAMIVVADLAATGQLGAVTDAALRRRLLTLDRRLAAAAAADAPEFDRYCTRLEESLSPGMWRYVFHGESGKYAVDFRAALRDLHAAGFDRTLRSLLRALEQHRTQLAALSAETTALRSELRKTDVGNVTP